MKRRASIHTLLGRAYQELALIQATYGDLLPTGSATLEFRMLVGDYLQRLRQALDYIGNEVYEGYGHTLKDDYERKHSEKGRDVRPYFPIAKAEDTRETFDRKLKG